MEKLKARQVDKGYSKQEGLDYHDTFSPIGNMMIVRCVIALVVSKGWCLYRMNAYNAFLQGNLDEEVYIKLFECFQKKGQCKVYRLLMSLNGLKQAFKQ